MLEKIENLTINQLKKTNYKTILLQLPEGLKTYSTRLIEFLENRGYKVFSTVEPCFGACDIPVDKAKLLKVDAIVHLGHNEFYRKITDFPVVYVPIEIDINFKSDIDKFKQLPEKVGIITTVQHIKSIPKIKELLEKLNKKVFIGGQILGCWTDNAKRIENDVDCFLYVGSGMFHPLGLRTDKKVYVYDVEKMELKNVTDLIKREERKRYARIFNAKECNNFGIIVSTKLGQFNLKTAENIKKIIENKGKKAFIFVSDIIKKDYLSGLNIDCIINTACPRLVDDDFGIPILNVDEVLIALGDKNESFEK